jgi:hypothetical protein
MEEIPSREVVTMGIFLMNQHPAIVLFDFGASDSFMSQTFASKHDQKIKVVDKGRDVLISIRDKEYTMDLVVLPRLGIDVILGMK